MSAPPRDVRRCRLEHERLGLLLSLVDAGEIEGNGHRREQNRAHLYHGAHKMSANCWLKRSARHKGGGFPCAVPMLSDLRGSAQGPPVPPLAEGGRGPVNPAVHEGSRSFFRAARSLFFARPYNPGDPFPIRTQLIPMAGRRDTQGEDAAIGISRGIAAMTRQRDGEGERRARGPPATAASPCQHAQECQTQASRIDHQNVRRALWRAVSP
jgi:hypothetical protein